MACNHDHPTVRFNVGGTVFEASRTLFTTNDRMKSTGALSKMVNDDHALVQDEKKSIFIDRDGENFRHVLQFLRYGRVSLPLTINKASFLRDLDFYGIQGDKGTSIVEDEMIDESTANLQAAHRIITLNRECEARAKSEECSTDERECILVAHACFQEYMRTGGSLTITLQDPDIIPLATNVYHKRDMEGFDKYLAKYGLRQRAEATNTYSHRTGEYSYITLELEIFNSGGFGSSIGP